MNTRRSHQMLWLLAVTLGLLLALVPMVALAAPADPLPPNPGAESDAGIVPEYVPGNPTCIDLGYTYGFKPNSGSVEDAPGTFYFTTIPGVTVTWSIPTGTTMGEEVDWSSTFGIDAVIVKGGPNADSFVYDPPAESFGDGGLHTPVNPNTGKYYDISHVEFCYDYELLVSKTAETSYKRSWDWSIDKELVGKLPESGFLSHSMAGTGSYEVTVTAGEPVDSDWAVAGTITIKNPDPNNLATITAVTDVVSGGIEAAVICGVDFPYDLGPDQTLVCTYSASLPDGTARTNTATAETSSDCEVGSGSGTAEVTFGDPTELVDECADVTDDKYGSLGEVCVESSPKLFLYELTIPPVYSDKYACGAEYTYDNTATVSAKDSGRTTSDTATISFQISCSGCTLTPGYWKTHSLNGPAPYDDGWLEIGAQGAATGFFTSGQSWYQVLWTSPSGGNAYYILAHAYIAAKLNVLNGAPTSAEVNGWLSQAETLFGQYTPAAVGDKKFSKATRSTFISLAYNLDQYNNGMLPIASHCGSGASLSSGQWLDPAWFTAGPQSLFSLYVPVVTR